MKRVTMFVLLLLVVWMSACSGESSNENDVEPSAVEEQVETASIIVENDQAEEDAEADQILPPTATPTKAPTSTPTAVPTETEAPDRKYW